MKTHAVLIIFTLLICSTVSSQNLKEKKAKTHDIWLKTVGDERRAKGILYEVNDTSLQIFSNYSDFNSTYNYQQIDFMKIRRKNNVLKGALIGGAIGFVTMLVAVPAENEEEKFIRTLISLPGSFIGAGIGAGIGAIKITIPIKGNRDNYFAYRNKLNYFAVNKNTFPVAETSNIAHIKNKISVPIVTGEKPSQPMSPTNGRQAKSKNASQAYEHESYIGWTMGPSFIFGDIADNFRVNNKIYTAKTGYCSYLLNIAYRIKGNTGISFTMLQNQYNTISKSPDEWWSATGFAIGPMFSFPLRNKLIFDIKPCLGLSGASLNIDENIQYQEEKMAFALNPRISMRYNFARRWCAITEAGYIYSNPEIYSIGKTEIQSANLTFGIAYRYK